MNLPQPYEFNGEIYEPKFEIEYAHKEFNYGIRIKWIKKDTKEYAVYDTYKEIVSTLLKQCDMRIINCEEELKTSLKGKAHYSNILRDIEFHEHLDKELK